MGRSLCAATTVLLVGVLALSFGCKKIAEEPKTEPKSPVPTQTEPKSPVEPKTPLEKAEKPQTPPTSSEPLLILCGNSFEPPVKALVEMYQQETGAEVEMSLGGSETLLPQVKLKAAGDVFVTHTPFQQETRDAGALLREVAVGFQAPVLVVRKGNPSSVTGFADLATQDLRVVLPDPDYSTCGQMVFKRLEEAGIKDAVLENVANQLVRDHAMVGNQLKLGAADAGIMWNGVANIFKDDLMIVPDQYAYEEIKLSVMGLSYSKNQEQVEEFLDFVEEHGRQVFEDFGYVK